MANTKQQAKRILTNEKRRQRNASFRSSLKTAMKAVDSAIAEKDAAKAKQACAYAYKKLDKAVAKGFVHKNNAARHKSQLSLKVNALVRE